VNLVVDCLLVPDREQMYARALATLSALITPIEMNSSTILPNSVVATHVVVVDVFVTIGFCGTVGVNVPVETDDEEPPPPPVDVVPPVVPVVTGMRVNVAATDLAADIVVVHVPVVLVHEPLHPVNVEPDAGVAVRVTEVPLVIEVEHVVPQDIPEPVMVPDPVPP
jgi:hypothetical protein